MVSPAYIKWLSPLLLLASLFTFTFVHGGTDALFVPFMMLAALRWDDFVTRRGPRWTGWLGPVALGVACSIKQTPWFCVPFFFLVIALEARRHDVKVLGTVARYASLVAAPFVAINIAFIVWSPGAWLHGVLLPLTQPLLPDGQGLVSLATHGFVRVVHPLDLELAGGLLLLALMAATVTWYPRMKQTWLFALPIALFVPSRSFSSYLVDFVPAAFVALISTQREGGVRTRRVRSALLRGGALALPVAASVVMMVLAFTSVPLSISVDHYSAHDHNQYMGPITLTLTNHTSSAITPHVMVVIGSGHPVGFWKPDGTHVATVPPHSSVTAVWTPPRYMLAPEQYENWLVEVLTSQPNALATTPAYSWPYSDR